MPTILIPKIFEDKDLSLYDEKEFKLNSTRIFQNGSLEIRLKEHEKESIWEEDNLFMLFKNKMIANMEFWVMNVNNHQIPKIKNVVVLRKFRGNGFGTIMYNTLFDLYGCLASDTTLNGNKKSPNGSYGLWLNLIKTNESYIFDEIDNKFLEYSHYKAFESVRKGNRRVIIVKNDWINEILNKEITVSRI